MALPLPLCLDLGESLRHGDTEAFLDQYDSLLEKLNHLDSTLHLSTVKESVRQISELSKDDFNILRSSVSSSNTTFCISIEKPVSVQLTAILDKLSEENIYDSGAVSDLDSCLTNTATEISDGSSTHFICLSEEDGPALPETDPVQQDKAAESKEHETTSLIHPRSPVSGRDFLACVDLESSSIGNIEGTQTECSDKQLKPEPASNSTFDSTIQTSDHPIQPPDCPIQTSDYPIQPPDCPIQTSNHPIQPPDCPIQPPDCPIQTSDHPIQPPDCPIQTSDYPIQPPDCPIQTSNHPIQPPDCPIQTSDHPIQPPDCPIQPPDCPIQTSDYPIQTSDHPMQPPDCSIQTSDHPIQLPDCPIQTSDHPIQTSDHPIQLPDQTSDHPIQLPNCSIQTSNHPMQPPNCSIQTSDHPIQPPDCPIQTSDHPIQPPDCPIQTSDHPIQLPNCLIQTSEAMESDSTITTHTEYDLPVDPRQGMWSEVTYRDKSRRSLNADEKSRFSSKEKQRSTYENVHSTHNDKDCESHYWLRSRPQRGRGRRGRYNYANPVIKRNRSSHWSTSKPVNSLLPPSPTPNTNTATVSANSRETVAEWWRGMSLSPVTYNHSEVAKFLWRGWQKAKKELNSLV